MEMNALIALFVDRLLAQCPQYDRVSVTMALESMFAGNSTMLGDNTIAMLFGQHNNFTNATITIGHVHAGNRVEVSIPLPQPIDPISVALTALASIPHDYVPIPRSDVTQVSNLTFKPNPHFVGRETELKVLAAAIGTAHAAVMPTVVTGLGGVGKTNLLVEFTYRYGAYFHGGVFWLNCADPAQVASQIAACAVDLGIDPTGLSLNEQVQQVMVAWQSPMPRLLIFDNCEYPSILEQWKPSVGSCRVLVTSRSVDWPALQHIRLGLLSPAESRDLLQQLCARLTHTEADAIADDLGHLPLALHLAGSYLNTYDHHTVEEYRTELTIAHRSLKGRGALLSPTRHELDIEATFMLSLNQLDPTNALDTLALGMLDGAAWCAPGVPLPRNLVLSFVPDGTDTDDSVDALRRLQQLGLLDGADGVVLHRLLAQVVQAQLGSPEMLAVVENQINAVAASINDRGIPSHMLLLEPHLRHATMRALDSGDARAARLSNCLGFLENLRGAYVEAQRLYQRALTINEVALGPDHPDTAQSMNGLAGVLADQGRYMESQELHERALAVREAMLGPDHPDTVQSMNGLAGVLARQGLYAKAQRLYERALAVREAVLGPDHPDTAQSMDGLAGVLARQGLYAKAQRLYERALTVYAAVLGREHPDTVASVNNLAGILADQGLYAKAQELYEQALIVWEAMLGREHPDTAASMNNLAFVLERQGQYGEAQELYEQALIVWEAMLGREHPDTAASMNNLAFVLERQGQYEESQKLYERALAIYKAGLGEGHPDTQLIRANLEALKTHMAEAKTRQD